MNSTTPPLTIWSIETICAQMVWEKKVAQMWEQRLESIRQKRRMERREKRKNKR